MSVQPVPTVPAPAAEAPDLSHVWIVAAEIVVSEKIAKHAALRLSFKPTTEFVADPGQRIDALEVYCRDCKRPLDDVGDQPCAAKIDNRHLIGGDQSVRAKRKPMPEFPESARRVTATPINRRGMDAYLSGHSR